MADRSIWRAWAACLLLALALPAAADVQVTDDRGVTVRFARAPQRVVSVLPALTETVCALGACERLVGVDRYSNHPAQVRKLPRVGGGIDPSLEAIVALKPDVVLMATSSRGAERLEALGLKVLALEPRDRAAVQRVLATLGRLLDVPSAPQVWQAMETGVEDAARTVPPAARGARVYFEVNRGPYAAGPSSFIGELMERLGARNIVGRELGPYPRLNPEFVVRADPDVILIGERNADGLAQRPGWSGLRALRQDRVCIFREEEADVLVRAGPRMAEAAQLLARCLAAKGVR